MLRSVFGKFQTVFRQTVISPKKTCRHYPKHLPRVIIGITTGVASYYLLKKLKPFPMKLKGSDYENKFSTQSLIHYPLNSLEELLEKYLFEPISEVEAFRKYESEFPQYQQSEFSLYTLFHYSPYLLKSLLFERIFEFKMLEGKNLLSPPFFQWQYAWQMVKSVADRVEQASPAVVRIIRHDGVRGGLGTGFFVGEEGLILTNEHIVRGVKRVTVITTDDKLYHGDVLSCDTKFDLAVIQIQGATKKFATIKLGDEAYHIRDSDKITINDSVIVIGSSAGIKNSVMSGVVSKTNSTNFGTQIIAGLDNPDFEFFDIQTHIPTYPGSSGSPVINQDGEAIGITWGGTDHYWFNKWTGNATNTNSPSSWTYATSSNEAKNLLTKTKNLEKKQISQFAELETLLDDGEQTRAIYELVINQPGLDMPEFFWKAYIDFEIGQGEFENARKLYERLLERTSHVKVWLSYAKFENDNNPSKDGMNVRLARRVYERANESLKASGEKESRVLLLENWKEFEGNHGDDESKKKINGIMPRRIKKRRKIIDEDGTEHGWEEIFDYIFPEDETSRPN